MVLKLLIEIVKLLLLERFYKMETSRLIIDELREDDAYDYYYNISHDKKVLETFICEYCDSFDSFDIKRYLNKNIYAIRLKSTNKLIGIILYFGENDGECEVGYGIGSNYWNQGFASEALKIFISNLFSQGFKTIYASFFEENSQSKRVMEKNGMIFHHFSENELIYQNRSRNLVYYYITK